MKNNQSGRSMVEMLGVLAIIGVLSAGGLAGYSKAMFKHKLNSTMDQITMLVTNIRTMYGTQGNYSGFTAGSAVDLGIVPAVMIASDTPQDGQTPRAVSLTNPFKGDVELQTIKVVTGDTLAHDNSVETGFSITYKGLPDEACIALGTADFGSGAGSGFIGAKINSGAMSGQYGAPSEGSAYAMGDTTGANATTGAITLCTGDNNQITWYFY